MRYEIRGRSLEIFEVFRTFLKIACGLGGGVVVLIIFIIRNRFFFRGI